MLRDETGLARMRCSARKEFADKFTAEANYRRLMTIYERALGGTARRGIVSAEAVAVCD
jgi:hypothetical protein